MNRKKALTIALASGVAGGALALGVSRALASGIPATKALTYSGFLEDSSGMPVDGSRNIAVEFWSAATLGTKLCERVSTATTVSAGRFSVQLDDTCTAAVKANKDVWVNVAVAGFSLGRTKLGAVPYAVEADRAQTVPWTGVSGIPAPTYAAATTSTEFTTASTSFADIPGLAATLTTQGKPVLVTAMTNLNANTGAAPSGLASWGVFTVTRDGTNLGHAVYGIQIAGMPAEENVPVTITFVDTPPAGQHTYRMQVRAGEAAESLTVGQGGTTQQIAAMELR